MKAAAGSSEIHKLGPRGPSSAWQTNMFCQAGSMTFKILSVNALGQECIFCVPQSTPLPVVTHPIATAGFCSQQSLSSVL